MEIILQRSTSDEEPTIGFELPQFLRDLTVLVLDLVSFVDHHVFPFELKQVAHTNSSTLEGGQTHVELSRDELGLEDIFSFLFACYQVDNSEAWVPLFEFLHPVRDSTLRNDDKVWPWNLFVFHKEGQERYGLDGLSETHLIGKDSVDTSLIQANHPVETIKLKLLEFSVLQERGLLGQLCQYMLVFKIFLGH